MSKQVIETKAVQPLQEQPPQLPAVINPMAMIERAIADGAGIDVLTKLMDLQDRYEAAQARKSFVEAFAAFKAEAVIIVRNKRITDGPLKGKNYAELSSFVDAVTPALSKHGLSASWAITRDEKDWIEVTCNIEHVRGHAKCVALGGPPDTGGAKNAIQARMSTVTYLERHTLKAACGISEQGDDADGAATGNGATLSDEQIAAVQKLITATKTKLDLFLKWAGVPSVSDIPAAKFGTVIAMLEKKKGGQS